MSNLAWVVIWIICAIIAWIIAARKGRSGLTFFVTSVCLTPIVGIAAAILAKSSSKPAEDETDDDSPGME